MKRLRCNCRFMVSRSPMRLPSRSAGGSLRLGLVDPAQSSAKSTYVKQVFVWLAPGSEAELYISLPAGEPSDMSARYIQVVPDDVAPVPRATTWLAARPRARAGRLSPPI